MNQFTAMVQWLAGKVQVASSEERGGGEIIAVVIIIAIVIALGILFQDSIGQLFNDLWNNVTGNAASVGTIS